MADDPTREPSWWVHARRLRERGMTYNEIARLCGVSYHAVGKLFNPRERQSSNAARLKRYHQTKKIGERDPRPTGARYVAWWRSARTLRERGWQYNEIAAYHNVVISNAWQAARLAPAPPDGQRWCAVCAEPFPASPSSKTVTCSKSCSIEHRRRAHVGVSNSWSDAGRANARSAAARTGNLRGGTPAAQQSPIAGPFETNQEAKRWWVVSPDGDRYEVVNLAKWLRDHADLLPDGRADLAYTGLKKVQAWLTGSSPRKVGSWKGWTLERPARPVPENILPDE